MYNPSLKILEVCEKLEWSAGIYLTTNAWKLTDYSKRYYSCFCFYYSLFYASAFDGNTRWEGHLIPLQYLLSSVLELWWEWQFITKMRVKHLNAMLRYPLHSPQQQIKCSTLLALFLLLQQQAPCSLTLSLSPGTARTLPIWLLPSWVDPNSPTNA